MELYILLFVFAIVGSLIAWKIGRKKEDFVYIVTTYGERIAVILFVSFILLMILFKNI